MRPLEIGIIVILTLYVLSFFLKREKRPVWIHWIPLAATALLALHVIIEGIRWQMAITYLLTTVYLMFWIKNRASKNKEVKSQSVIKRIGSIFGRTLVLCLLGATLLVANILPVSEPFPPSGKHKIGTTFFHLIDHDRQEVLTENSDDVRSLWVQAWYPAETTKSFKRVQVFSESENFMGQAFEHRGFPKLMASHLPLIKSHSYLDAPIKEGDEPFPVILFSHAYTGHLESFPSIEELVSQGYVVFSIAHSYESGLSLDQDGEWISYESVNRFEDNKDTAEIKPLERKILSIKNRADSTTNTDYLAPLALTEQDKIQLDSLYKKWYPSYHYRTKIWVADQRFVLDEAERMQSGAKKSIFKDKLDLTRVGAIGASFGGSAVAYLSSIDNRCLAVAGLDGGQAGMLYRDTTSKPYMVFWRDYGWKHNLIRDDWENIGRSKPYYRIGIKGSTHGHIGSYLLNFSLQSKIGMAAPGVTSQYLVYEIYNSYLVAFFDRHIKGKEQQKILDGEERFEEVNFRVH